MERCDEETFYEENRCTEAFQRWNNMHTHQDSQNVKPNEGSYNEEKSIH
jgi:hypothetical protein